MATPPTANADDFELLAPAGNWDCARAAVENGANAIYFGLESGFNARARAANFSVADLPPLLEYLHLRNVRGYVTLNTLVFSTELPVFEQHLRSIAQAGVDAVLVQDLGAAQLMRRMCPDLELHASTQMTITSEDGLKTAESMGIARAVLPRELSIGEIQKLNGTSALGLEAFVHGALCVAYSGQCLTSESLGGRSANRGQCAQACRLPYDVFCDDEFVELGDVKYLLSPQDLAAHALLPDLIAAGVRSFKIEGRLKTPEYVANVTRHYRRALDAAIADTPFALSDKDVEELEMSFSRGFSQGWLNGCDHKMLVPGESSAKRGVLIGEVVEARTNSVAARLYGALAAGDGVVFEGGRLEQKEQGGRLFAVTPDKRKRRVAALKFGRDAVRFDTLRPGQKIWKTDDPQLNKRLRSTFNSADPIRKTALDIVVHAEAEKPLRVIARAKSGAHCEITLDELLPVAKKHPCTIEKVREELGRLGATVYALRNVDARIVGEPMVPLSMFGKARKRMISALDDSIRQRRSVLIRQGALDEMRAEIAERNSNDAPTDQPTDPSLHVTCRYMQQLEAALETNVSTIYADFADIREYRDAVAMGRGTGTRIFLATPRIEKPGEHGLFRAVTKHDPDGVLVRNFGGLRYCADHQIPFVTDFSLNAANELSVDWLKRSGAERVTASYDLNRDQMLELIEHADTSNLEVVVHQHMPMFHMEHCVFCAVLSPGTNKHNCGRPCDDHTVQLRDRVGMKHPLHADVGCRNTLYNATAQSSAEIVAALLRRGVRHYRVELLENSVRESKQIIATYERLLRGELSGAEVWKKLQANNQVGVTRGTLEERRNPLAII